MSTSLPSHDDVARRATEIWNQRGQPSGSDTEIWLEAERQLSGNQPLAGNKIASTEFVPLAERVKEETVAESSVEYLMSPEPTKKEAIAAAVKTQNAKPPTQPDHGAQPGLKKTAGKPPRKSGKK